MMGQQRLFAANGSEVEYPIPLFEKAEIVEQRVGLIGTQIDTEFTGTAFERLMKRRYWRGQA